MAKMDRITAEAEFQKWAESWGLDFKTGMDDEEARDSFEQQKSRLLTVIEEGRMIFENDALCYVTSEGNEIVMREPKGAAFMALDNGKDGQNIRRMHEFLASVASVTPNVFAALPARDWKVLQACFVLFTTG